MANVFLLLLTVNSFADSFQEFHPTSSKLKSKNIFAFIFIRDYNKLSERFLRHPDWLFSFCQSCRSFFFGTAADLFVESLCFLHGPFNAVANLLACFAHPAANVLGGKSVGIDVNVDLCLAGQWRAAALFHDWQVEWINSLRLQAGANFVDVSSIHVFCSRKNCCWLTVRPWKFLACKDSRVLLVISHENLEDSVTRKNVQRELDRHFRWHIVVLDFQLACVWIAMRDRQRSNQIVLAELLNQVLAGLDLTYVINNTLRRCRRLLYRIPDSKELQTKTKCDWSSRVQWWENHAISCGVSFWVLRLIWGNYFYVSGKFYIVLTTMTKYFFINSLRLTADKINNFRRIVAIYVIILKATSLYHSNGIKLNQRRFRSLTALLLTFLMSKLCIGSTWGHSPDLYLCAEHKTMNARKINRFLFILIIFQCTPWD